MISRLAARGILVFAATAAVLFVAAGTLAGPAAWILLLEIHGSGLAIGLWLARHDPRLLAERLSPPFQDAQESLDKVIVGTAVVLWHAWLIVMAFDAVRYRDSQVPSWVQGAGALGLAAAMYLVFRTFRENSYAAPVVKIQKERGHQVVTTGPYAHVRHPMYAGALVLFLSAPLLLGSWWGLVLAPALVAVLAVRIVVEERLLSAGLAGYPDYAARVRYRLIPWVW